MMQILRNLCWAYTGLFVVGALAAVAIGATTVYGNRSGTGCNLYDALLLGIDCRGFLGAGLIEFVVGFALVLAQVSWFAFASLWMLIPAALLWSPIFYLIYRAVKRQRATCCSARTHS
jgi:hypothetical protein